MHIPRCVGRDIRPGPANSQAPGRQAGVCKLESLRLPRTEEWPGRTAGSVPRPQVPPRSANHCWAGPDLALTDAWMATHPAYRLLGEISWIPKDGHTFRNRSQPKRKGNTEPPTNRTKLVAHRLPTGRALASRVQMSPVGLGSCPSSFLPVCSLKLLGMVSLSKFSITTSALTVGDRRGRRRPARPRTVRSPFPHGALKGALWTWAASREGPVSGPRETGSDTHEACDTPTGGERSFLWEEEEAVFPWC